MAGGLFVLRDDKTLVEMQSAQFVTEDRFQDLLARFPALLSGDQINQAVPRRWILVKREKGVPAEDGGSDRWSIDHLFIDQDGIPTLVEVKRQSDTRVRREVVGQMLDYAANGVAYWSIEEIRSQFESLCEVEKKDSARLIAELIGPDRDIEQYWQQVKTNLQAGRIRLLFVADLIPPELRRIVEFLNKQMDPAEVLALELRQFVGQGLQTLVPHVYGKTEEADAKKGTGGRSRSTWNEPSIFEALEQNVSTQELAVARQLAAWVHEHADKVKFGSGATGSMSAIYERQTERYNIFSLLSDGRIWLNFGYAMKPPFDRIEMRRALQDKVNAVDGIRIDAGPNVDTYPTIRLSDLVGSKRLMGLLAALEWFVAQLPPC